MDRPLDYRYYQMTMKTPTIAQQVQRIVSECSQFFHWFMYKTSRGKNIFSTINTLPYTQVYVVYIGVPAA